MPERNSRQGRINLIFIAGTGRCGSTLLDMLLGAHSRIATSGEIHVWPHELMQGGVKPCGCGSPMPECPFWNEVLRRVNLLEQPDPQIHFFREFHEHGKALRWKHMLAMRRDSGDKGTATRIRTYGQNNYDVYKAFLDLLEETNGIRPLWVVDSSKDPYRLFWLVRSGLFNIKVLHSIRDPRGFVYSSIKLARHQDSLWRMVVSHGLRKSILWVLLNLQILQIAKAHLKPSDYLLVRYEDLASRPRKTLQEVARILGCEFEESMLSAFRGGAHAVAGNPMRHDRKGIVLDEAWRKSLPASCQRVTQLVTWIGRSRFGY